MRGDARAQLSAELGPSAAAPRELGPVAAVARDDLAHGPPASSKAEASPERVHLRTRPLVLFGAHHKTGTWLISRLAKFQADAFHEQTCSIANVAGPCGYEGRFGPSCYASQNYRTWFDCHMTDASIEKANKAAKGNLRVVLVVRDPVAVVVSGYVYHTHEGSHDLAPGGLRRIGLVDGVAREAESTLTFTLPAMLSAFRWGQANKNVLVVRLEDLMASSESFDATVQRIYNFTAGDFLDETALTALGDYAKREDLRRRPFTDHSTSILEPELKRQALEALANIPKGLLQQLYDYKRQLGYA